MKNIQLVSLGIHNFKGIESTEISLSHRVEIYGKNGTGKTTILDAFLWCLFGKDSSGASDFSVKRKNTDGIDVQHIDVDVRCSLIVDNMPKSFRRRLVEMWTTPRGGSEPEFKGNTGEYFVNDVPVSAGDYAKEVSSICEESLFKLLTSTGAFNKLKDADRRSVLSKMADDISDLDLAADFPSVLEALKIGKTIGQYRDEIKSKKRRIVDEKEQYPARLKENADMRPQPLDFAALREEEANNVKEIDRIDKQLQKPAESIQESISVSIKDLDGQLAEIEQSLTRERNRKKDAIQSSLDEATTLRGKSDRNITEAENRLRSIEADITSHDATLQKIASEWATENSRTCEVNVDSACPTCGKEFSADDISNKKNEIIRKFNEDKLRRLDEIKKRGDSESEFIAQLKATKENIERDLSAHRDALSAADNSQREAQRQIKELPELKLLLEANTEYVKLRGERDELRSKLNAVLEPSEAEANLKIERSQLEENLNTIRRFLATEGEIERADKRREELLSMQAKLGQDLASLEAIEHEILQFSIRKTDLIESSISSKFKFVRFKMFDYNITNDGVKEVCVCTVNGVPYPDLNTAMQINADIDIINSLSAHYGITAPVFIDHAESINEIGETAGQRIDLYATTTDDTLRITQK